MPLDGARRSALPTGTVTFLFSDIEGSTSLLVSLGDHYASVLERHAALFREAISAAGGTEVNTEGDSFFVAFTRATGAVAAAAEIQRMLASEPWPSGVEVRVRMGIHTGEGRLGGDDYIGLDVHRAARIMAAGHGGQVLLSDACRALVRSSLPTGASLRDLGRHHLKDLPDPEQLWQLQLDGLQHEFPALRTVDRRPTNLPLAPPSLIGRDAEVEAVRSLLAEHPVVTLSGPGGTGKTRLSMAVAESLLHAYADGVWFVPLQDARDRRAVATEIAEALGVRERQDRDAEASVAAYLRDRAALLVLDNFEQVLDAAPLVGQLVSSAPAVRSLVTSREVLRIDGEREFAVRPLATKVGDTAEDVVAEPSDAVRLFVARAQEVQPGFSLTAENADAVGEIVERVDGLPLAIELAAVRLRVLTPESLLDRMDKRLPLLRGGGRDRPERQQTLRGAIEWSTDMLDPAERRLFERLSVFAGGWSLDAAESVFADEPGAIDVLDGLESLSQKSLLRRIEDEAEAVEARFDMLQVVREYATERLEMSDDADSMHRRHAHWLLALVERAMPELERPELRRWQRRLRTDDENIRSALRWCLEREQTGPALRISGALWRYWHYWATVREGVDWLEQALQLPDQADFPAERAGALKGLAGLVYWQGQMEYAEELYVEALSIRRTLGNEAWIADALTDAAWTAYMTGETTEAEARSREASRMYHALGDEARALSQDAYQRTMSLGSGDMTRVGDAIEAAREASEASHRAGRPYEESDWLSSVAFMSRAAGDLTTALEYYRRAMALLHELGAIGWTVPYIGLSASLELALGRPERAVRLAAAGARFTEQLGGTLPESMTQMGDPIEEARAALSPEDHARAVEAGRTMSFDETVAFMLESPPA